MQNFIIFGNFSTHYSVILFFISEQIKKLALVCVTLFGHSQSRSDADKTFHELHTTSRPLHKLCIHSRELSMKMEESWFLKAVLFQ